MTGKDQIIKELTELVGDLDVPEPTEAVIVSPVRSAAGRIRNLKAMKDEKFAVVLAEMRSYQDRDPEGWAACTAENTRRYE